MIIPERLSEVVGVSGSQKRSGVQTRSVTWRAPSRVPGRAEPTTPRLPGHGHRGVPGMDTVASPAWTPRHPRHGHRGPAAPTVARMFSRT